MYPTKSARPGQGARLWAPCVSEKIDRPASLGSHGLIASFQLEGNTFRSGGNHEEQSREGGDPACGVANDRSDGEREHPDQHQVDGATDHRARHPGM